MLPNQRCKPNQSQVWPSPTSYYNALHWGQIFNEGKQSGKPSFFQFNVCLCPFCFSGSDLNTSMQFRSGAANL